MPDGAGAASGEHCQFGDQGRAFRRPAAGQHRQGGVPASFDTVIETGLATAPARRYATGRDLAHACRAALAGPGRCPAGCGTTWLRCRAVPADTPDPRCRAVGAGSLGLDHSGAAIPQRFLPGQSVWRAEVSNRTGCGSGHCGLRVGCACLGHHPYGPSQQFAASRGPVPYGGAPYGTGPQGTGPYVPAASPVSDRAARLSGRPVADVTAIC